MLLRRGKPVAWDRIAWESPTKGTRRPSTHPLDRLRDCVRVRVHHLVSFQHLFKHNSNHPLQAPAARPAIRRCSMSTAAAAPSAVAALSCRIRTSCLGRDGSVCHAHVASMCARALGAEGKSRASVCECTAVPLRKWTAVVAEDWAG